VLSNIPVGTRKDFFEKYRQFEHELSKMVAIPDLGIRSLSLLIRGAPGMISGLFHVEFFSE